MPRKRIAPPSPPRTLSSLDTLWVSEEIMGKLSPWLNTELSRQHPDLGAMAQARIWSREQGFVLEMIKQMVNAAYFHVDDQMLIILAGM